MEQMKLVNAEESESHTFVGVWVFLWIGKLLLHRLSRRRFGRWEICRLGSLSFHVGARKDTEFSGYLLRSQHPFCQLPSIRWCGCVAWHLQLGTPCSFLKWPWRLLVWANFHQFFNFIHFNIDLRTVSLTLFKYAPCVTSHIALRLTRRIITVLRYIFALFCKAFSPGERISAPRLVHQEWTMSYPSIPCNPWRRQIAGTSRVQALDFWISSVHGETENALINVEL